MTDNTMYQAFFQHSSEAMLLADMAANILAANPAACELFRYPAAELYRSGCNALFENAGDIIRQCIDGHLAGAGQIMLRGDGSRFTGKLSAFRQAGNQGENLVSIIVQDIAGHEHTAHAVAEANTLALLSQSEERFRTLSESALSGIFIIEDGLLSYVNPAVESIFAYAEDELLGSSPLALIHPCDQARIAEDIARAFAGELISVHYPVTGKRKDGQDIEIDVLATTIELNGHKAIIGNVLDITERRRAETALRNSEQRFQLSMEATNEGVWDWNVSTGEVYYSPACYHMLGFTEEDFPGNLQSWQNLLHEDDAELAMQANMACVEGRSEVFTVEYRLRTKDGGWRWILARGKSITRDGNGRSLRLVGTNSDISERKLADEKITAYLKQLENAMQGTLLAVSNMIDMRDPYTAGHERRVGMLAADIAREMGWPESQCKNLQMIGLVHDIGKISIPSEILSRPGKISALEYQIIQAHAQNGYEILKDVEFPLPIAEIIYQHHERLDGSGYPRGLSGDEILPETRILSVADVLESMSSHRPYRASLGIEKTLEEIERGKGSLFDAEVVDACLRLFRIKGYVLPE